MNKKINSKVNGGMAIYYGMGSAAAAIGGVVGISTWLFKVFTDQIDFSWGTLIGLTIMTAVLAAFGYSLLRIGYEEIER